MNHKLKVGDEIKAYRLGRLEKIYTVTKTTMYAAYAKRKKFNLICGEDGAVYPASGDVEWNYELSQPKI